MGLTLLLLYIIGWKLIGESIAEEKRFRESLDKMNEARRLRAIEGRKKWKKSRRMTWREALWAVPLFVVIFGGTLTLGAMFGVPAAMDLPRVIAGHPHTLTGTVDEAGRAERRSSKTIGYNYFIRIDGKYRSSNVKAPATLAGKKVEIRYLKHTDVVLKIKVLSE